jgi:CheY-like chemotaxis protein
MPTPSSMRILYLEDEAIIALETAEVLRDLGFTDIALAHNLGTAERLVSEAPPDLALLDVNLSHGRTSFDLARRLTESGIPVIFATGYASQTLPQNLTAVVIEKPFMQSTLERAISEAVGNRPGSA